MAFDRMKAVYSAFCFCFLIETASCQVRLGDAVENRQVFSYMARLDVFYNNYMNVIPPVAPYLDSETCGGTVLTKHFILTAAHCLVKIKRFSNTHVAQRHGVCIRLGVNPQNLADLDQQIWLNQDRNFLSHRDFELVENSDIALIHSDDEIQIDNLNIVRALIGNEGSVSQEGWKCDISGWGMSTEYEIYHKEDSPVLKRAENTILDRARCRVQAQGPVINTNICTRGDQRLEWLWPFRTVLNLLNVPTAWVSRPLPFKFVKTWVAPSAMPGDSGGPLSCYPQSRPFYSNQHKSVYALVSHGPQPHYSAGWPAVTVAWTRVAAHRRWIIDHVNRIRPNEEVLLDGVHAAMGQFPYQVAIHDAYMWHKCSGAILSDQWVLAARGCFQQGVIVMAGDVEWYDDINDTDHPTRQMRNCRHVHFQNSVELCQLNQAFVFNRFVRAVDLMPEHLNPAECTTASWLYHPQRDIYYNYLRWKKAEIHGWPANPLDVVLDQIANQIDPIGGQGIITPGAALVCIHNNERDRGGEPIEVNRDANRYLVGVNQMRTQTDPVTGVVTHEIRNEPHFVSIRGTLQWIRNTAGLN